MGGQAKRVGVCHKASHHAHVIRFLQLHVPHGQEGIAEITWEFRQGPLQGHILAVDTEVIIEVLFKCLSESGTVAGAQGDKTSATATHRVLWLIHTSCQLHARLRTCRASMPATLHSDRNSDQRPATWQSTCHASIPAPLYTLTANQTTCRVRLPAPQDMEY